MLSLANCVNIGFGGVPEGAAGQPLYQLTPEHWCGEPGRDPPAPVSGYANAEEFMSDPGYRTHRYKRGQVFLFDDKTVTRPGPRIGGVLRYWRQPSIPEPFRHRLVRPD